MHLSSNLWMQRALQKLQYFLRTMASDKKEYQLGIEPSQTKQSSSSHSAWPFAKAIPEHLRQGRVLLEHAAQLNTSRVNVFFWNIQCVSFLKHQEHQPLEDWRSGLSQRSIIPENKSNSLGTNKTSREETTLAFETSALVIVECILTGNT